MYVFYEIVKKPHFIHKWHLFEEQKKTRIHVPFYEVISVDLIETLSVTVAIV